MIVAVLVALTTLASFSACAATGVERWNCSRNLRAPKMSDVSHSIALVGGTQILIAYDADSYGKYPHEKYTAHTVVYSKPRFETTVARLRYFPLSLVVLR